MTSPLVTCIIPTIPARSEWLRDAIASVEAQTYPCVEMLIDGEPGTIGEKRNRLCARARGEFVAHFDDDDLSGTNRLSEQVGVLIASGKSVTAYDESTCREVRNVSVCGKGGLRSTSGWWHFSPRELMGAALMYRRSWWLEHPFPDLNLGEDNAFIETAVREGQAIITPGGRASFCLRNHHGNTAGRMVVPGTYYTELPDGGVFANAL